VTVRADKALTVRLAREEDRPTWERFVAGRPEGDPLQTWIWGEIAATTGELPLRLLVEDSEQSPAPAIRGVAQALARPAGFGRQVLYVPHGPVWEREAADAGQLLSELLAGLGEAAGDAHGLVVKVDPRATPGSPHDSVADALLALGLRRARHDLQAPTTRLVELLDGGERLAATWDADTRNLTRRSAREGVATDVDRGASPEALEAFHRLLEATGERGQFRVRSLAFLEGLSRGFARTGGWYTVLARFEGRPIAGMTLPRVGDRAYYLYGASLREPGLKHKFGAYAAMAAGMQALAADGVRTLDLWGVVEPDDAQADRAWEGFSAFKRSFGGQPLRHPGTFDLVTDPTWYRIRDLRERLRDRTGR
jgi:lipid II:glycine glycyltransferase (peptidoglycan interpeptide bridge formation enzyme)